MVSLHSHKILIHVVQWSKHGRMGEQGWPVRADLGARVYSVDYGDRARVGFYSDFPAWVTGRSLVVTQELWDRLWVGEGLCHAGGEKELRPFPARWGQVKVCGYSFS